MSQPIFDPLLDEPLPLGDTEDLSLPPEQRKAFFFQSRWGLCKAFERRIDVSGFTLPGDGTLLQSFWQRRWREWPIELQRQCWVWRSGQETHNTMCWARNHDGMPIKRIQKVYPSLALYTRWNKKSANANRLAFEMFIQPLEAQLVNGKWTRIYGLRRHEERCDNPLCISPLHHVAYHIKRVNPMRVSVEEQFEQHNHELEVQELAEMIEGYVARHGIPTNFRQLQSHYGETYTTLEIKAALRLLGDRFTHLIGDSSI